MTTLDGLARELATPMPRRRAVRLIGATMLVTAFPALRGTPARAQTSGCPPECTLIGQKCCSARNGVVCVPPETTCCPGSAQGACPPGQRCAQVAPGSEARNCVAPCSAGQTACYSSCCRAGETCEKGKCVKGCPPGRARCGSKCCPKGYRCKDARRGTCSKCARGQSACGKKCCAKGTRCCDEKRGLCCKKEVSQCCQIGKGINPGNAVCCNRPSLCRRELVYGAGQTENDARQVCCPKERQVPLQETRCCPPGTESNGGDFILRPENDGVHPLCCPKAQVCKGGPKQTCCTRTQRCVNGTCVQA